MRATVKAVQAEFQKALVRCDKKEGQGLGEWHLDIWNTPTLYRVLVKGYPLIPCSTGQEMIRALRAMNKNSWQGPEHCNQ